MKIASRKKKIPSIANAIPKASPKRDISPGQSKPISNERTVPVTAHPDGASPFGAEQLAGNVWEWVADATHDGWGVVRGGSYLDTGWGLRACRVQPADPERPTGTTGFRIAIDEGSEE